MYSTACHKQEYQLKHTPQQAAQNQPTERKTPQPLHYHMWEFTG